MAANIADAVTEWARRTPTGIAAVDGRVRIGYRNLDRTIDRIAAGYVRSGWGPGTVVGVTEGGRPLAQLLVMLALARIGAVQVVVPLSDPPAQRVAVARRCRVSAIAGDRGGEGLDDLPAVPVGNAWLAGGKGTAPEGLRAPGGEAPWMIVHTSGTTGVPKAAPITHAMEIGRIEVLPDCYRYAPGERLASLVPVAFRVTRSVAIKCLSMGGTFIGIPERTPLLAALDLVERERVDVLMVTPSQLVDLLPHMPEDRPRLSGLRVLRSTAGAMPPALVAAVRRRISPNLHVDYGTNDAGSIAVALPADLERHPDTVGRPFERLEVQIVDGDGQPVPAGVEGEIRLRGPGVTREYVDDPDAARRVHRAGWFHPGDRARIDENGLLFIAGRTDDIMNVAGRKVAPAEIEAALANHPAVAEVAAVAIPSLRDQDVPAAVVVLRAVGEAPADIERTLLLHAAQQLGPHAPRHIRVVAELPRDGLGKIQRRRLVEILRAPLAPTRQE